MNLAPHVIHHIVNSRFLSRITSYDVAGITLPALGHGMASSTTAMLCTYPLNLIRTRLQARLGRIDHARRVIHLMFNPHVLT